MPEVRDRSRNSCQSSWQWFVIIPVVCLLALSVATRTSGPQLNHGSVVKSLLIHTTRQRLDKDAGTWVSPVITVTAFLAVSFYPRVSPAGPPIPSLFFEESLYYRPPPSC